MSTIHSQQDQSGSRIEIIANHLKPVVIRQENPINAQDALSFASLGRFVGLPLAKAPPQIPYKGKKHDNSLRLQRFVQGRPGLFVPTFRGIRDDYLLEEAGRKNPPIMKEIQRTWKELARLYKTTKDKANFFTNPNILRHFTEIERLLDILFSEGGKIALPSDSLKFIEETRGKNLQIIVRSSGDEDGDGSKGSQVAPGIHESFPAINASPEAVRSFIGKTIASYMSVKAMKAKAVDQENPFSKLPPWSVMLQEFVGETEEHIPISVVLATSEPLYVEGKEERVTTLNAAVGFGDGVTSGLVAPDAAILLENRTGPGITSYYESRYKPLRVVAEDGKSFKVPNQGKLQTARALSDAQIAQLYQLGKGLEQEFGYPLDVELVIRGDEIHIVQARHLVREKQTATYLNVDSKKVKNEVRFVSAIPNLAQVSSVTDPSKILVVNSIDDQFNDYKPGVHTHVIAKQMPGEYGHAALYFGSLKPPIPVFQIDDIAQFNALKQNCSPNTPLVFDVQKGKASLLASPIGASDSKQGWADHPTGRKVSLDLPENRRPRVMQSSILPLDVQTKLEELRSPDREKASHALEELGKYCFDEITSLDLSGHDAPFYQSIAEKTHDVWVELFSNIDNALSDPKVPYLERLLHVKMLERTLAHRRTSADDKSLSAFSLSSLRSELAFEQPATDYMRAVPDGTFAKEANLSHYALTPEAKELYISFLKESESSPEGEKAQFREMVSTMEKLGATPLWMNFFLAERTKGAKLSHILATFGEAEKALAEKSASLSEEIESVRASVTGSTTVKAMEKNWEDVVKILNSFEQIRISYKSLSPIAKALLLQTLHKAVDLADIAIKMSKNLPYPDEKAAATAMQEKVALFGSFVGLWGSQLLDKTSHTSGVKFTIHFHEYCNQLKSVLSNISPNKASMDPTPGYDVRSQVWGSDNIIVGRGQFAKSTEDIFTAYHRTMLICLNRAQNGIVSANDSLALPPAVRDLKTGLEIQYRNARYPLQYQGTASHENGISLQYQLPLNNHGMACTIEHDRHTGKTNFTLDLYTRGRMNMATIRDCIELRNLCNERKVIDPPKFDETANLFHAKWEVQSPEEAASLIEEFKFVENLSMDEGNRVALTNVWNREIQSAPPQVAKEKALRVLHYFMNAPTDGPLLDMLSTWVAAHDTDPYYREVFDKIQEKIALPFKDYLFNDKANDRAIHGRIWDLLPKNRFLQNFVVEATKSFIKTDVANSKKSQGSWRCSRAELQMHLHRSCPSS